MFWSEIFGFAGDFITFLGGITLAWDALGKQREFRRVHAMASAVKDPLLSKLKLTRDGVSLTNDQDVEQVFIRRTAAKALWGSGLLTVGFVCLLIARILGIVAQS